MLLSQDSYTKLIFQLILKKKKPHRESKTWGKQLDHHTAFKSVLCFVISLWKLSELLHKSEQWTAIKEQGKHMNSEMLHPFQWWLRFEFLIYLSYICSIAGTSWVTATLQTLMLPSGIHIPFLRRSWKSSSYSEEQVFPLSIQCTVAVSALLPWDS